MDVKNSIARRVALELKDGDVVNLGIGLPTLVANYVPEGVHISQDGHVDFAILGALQVDEKGSVASWMAPGTEVPGIDGAKEVIVAMEHTVNSKPKIMKKCTFPLTAVGVVKKIITEMGVMQITKDGIVLKELAPGISLEDIQAVTEARLIIPKNLLITNLEKHYLSGLID